MISSRQNIPSIDRRFRREKRQGAMGGAANDDFERLFAEQQFNPIRMGLVVLSTADGDSPSDLFA